MCDITGVRLRGEYEGFGSLEPPPHPGGHLIARGHPLVNFLQPLGHRKLIGKMIIANLIAGYLVFFVQRNPEHMVPVAAALLARHQQGSVCEDDLAPLIVLAGLLFSFSRNMSAGYWG